MSINLNTIRNHVRQQGWFLILRFPKVAFNFWMNKEPVFESIETFWLDLENECQREIEIALGLPPGTLDDREAAMALLTEREDVNSD